MHKLIQIEERVYGRLPKEKTAEWERMLSLFDVAAATRYKDYHLLEKNSYAYSLGKLVSSQRQVYNTKHVSLALKQPLQVVSHTNPVVTACYDSIQDKYYLKYAYFENDETKLNLQSICCEADAEQCVEETVELNEDPQLESDEMSQPIENELSENTIEDIPDEIEEDVEVQASQVNEQDIIIGKRARHKVFGEGVVENIEIGNGNQYIVVKFKIGLKKFQYPDAIGRFLEIVPILSK